MAMNRYMHPRNIFRTPPDFSKLAKEYPEFANIIKLEVNGKVSIDFKDPNSLRILTKCLLHSTFNLSVEISKDRLVPTLPLRLNYILWIEDLMSAIKATTVKGIDIGTGACAIYPLLGATKNKWNMIGTESDEFSGEMARKNITNNQLDKLIQIQQTSSSTLLQHLFLKENIQYDFCMCNPPFYSSIQELCESRSPARPPPKNGFTGSPQELITDGGELEFVRKLIAESKNLGRNIQIYTSMVGHKYNLRVLLEDLKSDKIKHTYTEFCQGRITRWGLAWTFADYNLEKLVPPNDKHVKKSNASIVYILPEIKDQNYNIENAKKKLCELFTELKISFNIVNKRSFCVTMDVLAHTNTWSNQRKRKRLLKRLEQEESKKIKLDVKDDPKDTLDMPSTNTVSDNSDKTEPVVHALCKIVKKENDVLLEFEYINGTGGKEGLHQIIQYIKNNWK